MKDGTIEPQDVMARLSSEVAAALRLGELTRPEAEEAQVLGLINIIDVPPDMWCPSLTPLGRDVCDLLEDRFADEEGP
jgi:hypothetical protein